MYYQHEQPWVAGKWKEVGWLQSQQKYLKVTLQKHVFAREMKRTLMFKVGNFPKKNIFKKEISMPSECFRPTRDWRNTEWFQLGQYCPGKLPWKT